jgi:hypothetical protein
MTNGLKMDVNISINHELIEINKYEYNINNMILTENDKTNIMNSGTKFLSMQERLTRLFVFIRTDNIYEFRKCISEDRSVINAIHNGTYLLHEACKRGAAEIVTFLLFSNAICDKKNSYGLMPQHYVVKSTNPIIIDILNVFGYNLNVKDLNGNTPLHHAIIQSNKIMVHLLINHNVNQYIRNNNKQTPMDICTNSEILLLLKDYDDLISSLKI